MRSGFGDGSAERHAPGSGDDHARRFHVSPWTLTARHPGSGPGAGPTVAMAPRFAVQARSCRLR